MAAAMMATALLLTGCVKEYPDDCWPRQAQVRVDFDWSETDARPEGMGVLFYPADGGDYQRHDFGSGGGRATVAPGVYSLIAFNNDTQSVVFTGDESFESLTAMTRPGQLTDGLSFAYTGPQPPRDAGSAGEPVTVQPDMLTVAVAADETISRNYLTDGMGPQTIVMTPRQAVTRYHVTVTGVENSSSLSAVSMALTGQAPGINMSTMTPVEGRVTVPGSLTVTPDGTLGGQMLTFGLPDTGAVTTRLIVYAWLRDNSKMVFSWDVAAQVGPQRGRRDITISVSGMKLPVVSGGTGGGMDVGVDNWDTIDIELST